MSCLKYLISSAIVQLFIVQFVSVQTSSIKEKTLPEIIGNTFYYFGYGSNLLSERLRIQNPTAQRVGLGLLKVYRLDFNGYSPSWNGAPATIVPTSGSLVYGALWQIELSNLKDIENQEGVSVGLYEPLTVAIELANNTVIYARTYRMIKQPKTDIKKIDWEQILEDRQPSKTYLQCIVKGAIETDLPLPYIDWLRSIKHNGRTSVTFEDILHLKDVELSD